MGDVVELKPSEDPEEKPESILKHTSYFDFDGDLGVIMKNDSLLLVCLNMDEFLLVTGDQEQLYTRAQIAEWLHLASLFVDSKDKYMPLGDLVAMGYDDE